MAATEDLVLGIEKNKHPWKLELFTDAAYKDIVEDKFKSTGGYLLYLGGNLIDWKTKKLKWVCTSSSEAEYLAFYFGCKHAIKTGRLIKDVFGIDVFPIDVFTDNQAVLEVIARKVPSDLNLHLSTKYLAPLQWADHKLIEPKYVRTSENPADGLTKVPTNFGKFIERILTLRGSVEKHKKVKVEDNLRSELSFGKEFRKEQNGRIVNVLIGHSEKF